MDGKAFFDDKRGGQGQGPGPGGEQIVHRTRHRQPADVAAGEKQGVHHEGIGGEGNLRSIELQDGAVVGLKTLGAIRRQEDPADQLPHLPPPGAVT